MANNHYTILTDVGAAKIANAIRLGEKIEVTELAVGDGGGKLPMPGSSATALVNEWRRAPINTSFVDDQNDAWVVYEQVLPPDVGGHYIREIGLYDAAGDLIAVGNYPEQYKPLLAEGASTTQTVRVVIQVLSSSAVTLKVDPSTVLATRQYVDSKVSAHEKSRNHPYADTANQGMVKFATLTAAKAGTDGKTALTPAGGMAQIEEHRKADNAHYAGKIGLDKALEVFGGASNVQAVLAMLGLAATMGRSSDGVDAVSDSADVAASTRHIVTLRDRIKSAVDDISGLDQTASSHGQSIESLRQALSDAVTALQNRWGNWGTNQRNDFLVNAKRALVDYSDNRLYVNFGDDFDGVVINGFITGLIAAFPGTAVPYGFLELDGATISRGTYARLHKFAVKSGAMASSESTKQPGQFGPGNGSTTFTLPDLRGEFVRGWDHGKGIDSGRSAGSWQRGTLVGGYDDNESGFSHSLLSGKAIGDRYGSDEVSYSDYPGAKVAYSATESPTTHTDVSSNYRGFTAVTRPRNVALMHCIKY